MKLFYSGWAVVATILLLTVIKVVDPTPLQSLRLQTFDALQNLDEVKQGYWFMGRFKRYLDEAMEPCNYIEIIK